MSFTTIPLTDIDVGQPTKASLFLTIKDDLDDHETRINSLEAGVNKVSIFNGEVIGYISHYSVAQLVGIGTYRSTSNIIITEAKIILINSSQSPSISSSGGRLEINLDRSTDNGVTWSTILKTRPSIEAGTYATGSTSGLVAFTTGGELLNLNDLLRVSITSKKDTQGSFLIVVTGELS